MVLASMADMEIATSCMFSSRFCAVTTTSSISEVVDRWALTWPEMAMDTATASIEALRIVLMGSLVNVYL